jgi:hypothetical protein
LIGQIEPILKNDLLPSSQAVAIAVKIPTAIVVDHHHEKLFTVGMSAFDSKLERKSKSSKAFKIICSSG